jgi:hypothetical protein
MLWGYFTWRNVLKIKKTIDYSIQTISNKVEFFGGSGSQTFRFQITQEGTLVHDDFIILCPLLSAPFVQKTAQAAHQKVQELIFYW